MFLRYPLDPPALIIWNRLPDVESCGQLSNGPKRQVLSAARTGRRRLKSYNAYSLNKDHHPMGFIQQFVSWFISFVLHMDKELPLIVSQIGVWTYAALFAVIFVETGLVVMPFLPGDSLLFAAGAVAAQPDAGII